jgi:hypothetical protein
MKANIPTSYLNLRPKEKKAIDEVIVKYINDQVNHEEAELQKIWLQYACIVLNRAFGFGEKRLITFLGNWKRMYRDNARFENKDDQTAYLKEHMDKLFPSGYPYEFIDKLEGK